MNDTIRDIEGLYPADSSWEDTASIGQSLLQEAMKNVGFNWRQLPQNVLEEYARLCIMEERTAFFSLQQPKK